MDWNWAIEKHREALKRVLAALVAMAGRAGLTSPLVVGEGGSARSAETDEGHSNARPTLPRPLRRAVLRLLHPAEAAARRLVIVAARGLVVPRRLTAAEPAAPRRPVANSVPRILFPASARRFPFRVRRPPSPNDPIEAARLAVRLTALASALDDLPGHRRFARWKTRAAQGAQAGTARGVGRIRRTWPLRPGRPPSQRSARCLWPHHEVHDILNDIHGLVFDVLQRLDTS